MVTVSCSDQIVFAQHDNLPEIKGGDPDGHDPLVIARNMAANGITLVSYLERD